MGRTILLHTFARPPWPWLFGLAGIGLILSSTHVRHMALPAFCGVGTAQLFAAGESEALAVAFAYNPPLRLLADWALMLLAMMPPLLAAPLMHVWRASLPRRRGETVAHFLLGYCAAWMAVGPVLIAQALLLQFLAGDAAFAGVLLLAIGWSASPWQRLALNRSHRLRRIGLFGLRADRDCLVFGIIHGGWCIMSCWVWMLVPLVAGQWHLAAMLFAGVIMLIERLTGPAPPRWRLPTPLLALHLPMAFARRQMAVRHG